MADISRQDELAQLRTELNTLSSKVAQQESELAELKTHIEQPVINRETEIRNLMMGTAGTFLSFFPALILAGLSNSWWIILFPTAMFIFSLVHLERYIERTDSSEAN